MTPDPFSYPILQLNWKIVALPLSLQLLKDWYLMLIVLILVMVDLLVLSTVTAVDSACYTVINVQDRENDRSVNVSQGM